VNGTLRRSTPTKIGATAIEGQLPINAVIGKVDSGQESTCPVTRLIRSFQRCGTISLVL
jgi:hypothetical protein